MALEIGALLKNRYRIEEIIAKGGMGAVYRSRDESLGIVVAIKENFFTNEEHARQFRREATMLASLRHPNLPRVTDHFTLPNQGQYLVMDFITGLDIRQRIAQDGRLAEAEVVEIGIAVCDALAYLHSREPAIVHRDIKPGNIKVAPNNQIYLVDFGLAKLSGQATTVGAQGLTPGYAPPEQYGQGTEPRSDIYALAATMYASLTGKIPEDALKRAMGSAKLVPIRSFNPTVSAPTAAAIEKAMAVSPDDRFAKAEAFKNALIHCRKAAPAQTNAFTSQPAVNLADEKTQVDTRPPGTYRPDENKNRRRFPALPVFGGLGILLIAALVYFLVIRPGAKIPEVTPTTQRPTETLVQTVTEIGATEVVAESPTFTQEVATPDAPAAGFLPGDGYIAFASDRESEPQIYLLNTQTGEIRRLKKMIGGACEPAWSPDGMSLAFISPCPKKAETHAGTTIYYITFKDDTLTTFDQFQLPTKTGGDFDPAWSSDGQQISFTTMRESSNKIAFVYTYDLKTNTANRIFGSARYDRNPSISPDGNLIAVEATLPNGISIKVIDQKQKTASINAGDRYLNNENPAANPEFSPDGQFVYFTESPKEKFLTRQGAVSGAPERIVRLENFAFDPSISPDGNFVVVEAGGDLYRVNIASKIFEALTSGSEFDFNPAWRPVK